MKTTDCSKPSCIPVVIHFYNKIIFKYVYSLFSKINIIITIKCTIYRGGRLGAGEMVSRWKWWATNVVFIGVEMVGQISSFNEGRREGRITRFSSELL